jgi:thymidylate synthase (FAD)
MKVSLIKYTEDAKELLIMTKNTRHFSDNITLESIKYYPEEKKNKEIEYVLNTIGSSWEFVDYVFLLKGVSRAFTHQLVRSRHASFAQQSLRLELIDDLKYYTPEKLSDNSAYHFTMKEIDNNYREMIDLDGEDPQDARGILPTNILTNIMVKMNLRTLADLISMRLCVRTQGEYREIAKLMRIVVLNVHPFLKDILDVYCIRNDKCPWGNFHECPVKSKYSHLSGYNDKKGMRNYFDGLNYNPQPKVDK